MKITSRHWAKPFALAALLLAACGPKEEVRDCCAKIEPPHASPEPSPTNAAPAVYDPAAVRIDEALACVQSLEREFHLSTKEIWVMSQGVGICPNNGVEAARIREIAGYWARAGCTKHTAAELLQKLDAGSCPTQAPKPDPSP